MTDKQKEFVLRRYRGAKLIHKLSLRVSDSHNEWLEKNYDPDLDENLSQLIRNLIDAVIEKGIVLNDGQKIGGNQNEVESVKKCI